MPNDPLLDRLLAALDAPQAHYRQLELYATNSQPLAYPAPEAQAALGNRFGPVGSNVCRLAVASLAERLRVVGFDSEESAALWAAWVDSDMTELAGEVHREALLFGDSYALVWADPAGRPTVTAESAKQVAVLADPARREPVAAVKRWITPTTTEVMVYEPDQVTRYRAQNIGATTGFRTVDRVSNPFGMVPVVPFRNSEMILGRSRSEIADLLPLVDALNKLLADMLVSSEYAGRPRRWATGIELKEKPVLDKDGRDTGETEAVNPIPDTGRTMTSENEQAKFGQLPSADLSGYGDSVRVIMSQIMAVSGLPAHYVGVLQNTPASADALRAAEASLTARAEAKQDVFGRSWERVAALMLAVSKGRRPAEIPTPAVRWADAGTRSRAAEADRAVKLYQAGLLPRAYVLTELGYTEDQVAAIMAYPTTPPTATEF
jgi:hypothetical protein